MIVTFCGHSDFQKNEEYEQRIFEILQQNIGNEAAEIYLGEHGAFDEFAYYCCKKYKQMHKNVSLVFITPYMLSKCPKRRYDYIIYPEIEDKPIRFAISYRNKYMIQMADFVIAFVEREWGGAYQSYKYAIRKGKVVFNLAPKNNKTGC